MEQIIIWREEVLAENEMLEKQKEELYEVQFHRREVMEELEIKLQIVRDEITADSVMESRIQMEIEANNATLNTLQIRFGDLFPVEPEPEPEPIDPEPVDPEPTDPEPEEPTEPNEPEEPLEVDPPEVEEPEVPEEPIEGQTEEPKEELPEESPIEEEVVEEQM